MGPRSSGSKRNNLAPAVSSEGFAAAAFVVTEPLFAPAVDRRSSTPDLFSWCLGDSELPPAIVAGGSSTTASVCSAVILGCDAIRAKLIHAAVTADDGPLSGAEAGTLDFADGFIKSPKGARDKIQDVFSRLGVGALEEYAEFVPKGLKPDSVAKLYGGQAKLVGGPSGEKLAPNSSKCISTRAHVRSASRAPSALSQLAA